MSRIARIILWAALALVLVVTLYSGLSTGEWLGSVMAGVLVALLAVGVVALGDLLWSLLRQMRAKGNS